MVHAFGVHGGQLLGEVFAYDCPSLEDEAARDGEKKAPSDDCVVVSGRGRFGWVAEAWWAPRELWYVAPDVRVGSATVWFVDDGSGGPYLAVGPRAWLGPAYVSVRGERLLRERSDRYTPYGGAAAIGVIAGKRLGADFEVGVRWNGVGYLRDQPTWYFQAGLAFGVGWPKEPLRPPPIELPSP